ncbi:MAG: hypothetical protein HUU56_06285 [Bdellovibrionaceae bacterium]|nr:hypothetical protein [Pseudobdellovibrionaceae bacterium]
MSFLKKHILFFSALAFVFPLLFFFQNCSKVGFSGAVEPSVNESSSLTTTSTCLFDDKVLFPGESVTAYKSASVPAYSSCESENRVCNNGKLSGSYAHATCVVDVHQTQPPPTTPPPSACVSNAGSSCMKKDNYYFDGGYEFNSLAECKAYMGADLASQAPCPNPPAGYNFLFKTCKNESVPTKLPDDTLIWRAKFMCASYIPGTVSCSGQCE